MTQRWRQNRQRLVVLAAAFTAAACGAAGTHPQPARAIAPAVSARNRVQAQAELVRLLASVSVPTGARRVATAPIAYLDKPPLTEGSPNLLSTSAFWRVDQPYGAVAGWVQFHIPTGLTSSGGGRAGGPGVPANVMIEFASPGTRAYTGAMLVVEVVAIAGGAGIRADAEVIWLPAKPSNEVVPPGTPVTVVAKNHFDSTSERTLLTKRLHSSDGNALIADLNALVPRDGGIRGCAADTGYRVLIEMTVGGVPEVFTDWPACATVLVTRAGKALPALSPTEPFQSEIAHLVGPPPSL